MRSLFIAFLAVALCGCAAEVKKDDGMSPIRTYADTRNRLLVSIQGDPSITAKPGWTQLSSAWRRALQDAAASADYQLGEQVGTLPNSAQAATVLIVEVNRLQQADAAAGSLGDAILRVDVRFADGPSGRLLGSRRYESASDEPESLQGQIETISKEIIGEVQGAQRIAKREALPDSSAPSSAPSAQPPSKATPAPAPGQSLAGSEHLSKPVAVNDTREQQLQKLQRSNLPFDQYQTEYRRLNGQ